MKRERISRSEIQEFIDLLIAFRDGAEIELGGYHFHDEPKPSEYRWVGPIESVYLDLYRGYCVKYFYRARPPEDTGKIQDAE